MHALRGPVIENQPVCTKLTPPKIRFVQNLGVIMELTISQARSRLGQLCTQVQDPREMITFTRHGRQVAGLVNFRQWQRIHTLAMDEQAGPPHPLFPVRWGKRARRDYAGWELGRDGKLVTPGEAAQQVRELQEIRAEERRILRAGGLEPVEDGEVLVKERRRRGKWWLG